MALVISADYLVKSKLKLPTEHFIVDTNILIEFKDPFGRSIEPEFAQKCNDTATTLRYLRNYHKPYTIISVAIEYYKYLQVNYYKTKLGVNEFKADDFKRLRELEGEFRNNWILQIKKYKTLFIKDFEIVHLEDDYKSIFNTYDCTLCDFGDQMLYKNSLKVKNKYNTIYTYDKDFYNLCDHIFLLTTNDNIINKAKMDNKLFEPKE